MFCRSITLRLLYCTTRVIPITSSRDRVLASPVFKSSLITTEGVTSHHCHNFLCIVLELQSMLCKPLASRNALHHSTDLLHERLWATKRAAESAVWSTLIYNC
jgi:hypothetical protein